MDTRWGGGGGGGGGQSEKILFRNIGEGRGGEGREERKGKRGLPCVVRVSAQPQQQ